ncbi:PREDICTED: lysosomal acid phosphatase-like isoform X2 [Nicrophorus vespilloides]|nr:PREDICTED: lysosomal acid phosphatase-like isoform X2 [Nicrophorus vespilloides]XP_017776627.1 PREDICTED: lysosomal acid phosphatase-like isoform X2 [Nicrophorus vespilloides]
MIGPICFFLSTILLIFVGAEIPRIKDAKELKLLHVVMRHGIRTPVSTYPNDPYINERFDPNGWGQLTNEGIRDLYEFGGYLRGKYGSFLGDKFNSSEFYSQATGVDRALASIMAVNAGLWKPNKAQTWMPNLRWKPIPVLSQPLDEDMLLLVRKDCPQYNLELKRVEESPEIQQKLLENQELFKYIQEKSGQKMENFYDVEDIYTTLLAEQSFGLKLPKWTKGYFPEKMVDAASMSFVLKAYNDKLQRLKGGVLLKKLLGDWTGKAANTLKTKAFVYGGHDTTISNLLSTLKIFDPQVPNYGMAVIFELLFDHETNTYGLEIFVKNSTARPYQMQLPGCDKFCPLETVIKKTKPVVPVSWHEECFTDDPDYKPPEQGGP